MIDRFIPANILARTGEKDMGKLFPKPWSFDHISPRCLKKGKDFNIVWNEIDDNPGISFQRLKENTGFGDRKLRNALSKLHNEDRIRRREIGYHIIDPNWRVFKPTGIHGLTLVFKRKLGDTLPPELEAYVLGFLPSEFWKDRKFKYNQNTQNTFYLSCTDIPLSRTELWLFWESIKSFFSTNGMHVPYHRLAKVHFNFDAIGIQISDFKDLTMSNFQSDLLVRTYRHVIKGKREIIRHEIEVRDITFEQALERMTGWLNYEALTRRMERQQTIILEQQKKMGKMATYAQHLEARLREGKSSVQDSKSGKPPGGSASPPGNVRGVR